MNIGTLEIKDMVFYAHHGCFEEEKIIGNRFIVNFKGQSDITKASETDSLDDAVNYQFIYNLIKEEMEIPSNLLENVAGRIIKRVIADFPALVYAKVSISKLNPPIGGQVGAFTLEASYGEER